MASKDKSGDGQTPFLMLAKLRAQDATGDLSEEAILEAYEQAAGETLDQTIVRRRMMRASRQLLLSRDSPRQIAKCLEFAQFEDFEREFLEVFGITPVSCRKRGRLLASKEGLPVSDLYTPVIRDWPAIRVAALRHYGEYIEQGIVLDRLYGWAGLNGIDYRHVRRFSLFHDDPLLMPVAALSSDCCLEVPANVEGEGDVAIFELPAARRVTVRHKGPYAELEMPFFWMTRWWAAQNGRRVKSTPILAEFVNTPRGIPPSEWLTDMSVDLIS